jgi:putative acetyltransferase
MEPATRLALDVRPEETADRARVGEILTAAFGRDAEARLVERLRGRVRPEISLVAVGRLPAGAERIVGHVYFSPVRVGEAGRPAVALGPVSVDPDHQGRGAGRALCLRGLETCREMDLPVVFVLGHPDYYRRLGFQPARPYGLYYRDARFDGAFFVAELVAGALGGLTGEVRYRPEFDEV